MNLEWEIIDNILADLYFVIYSISIFVSKILCDIV